MEKLVISGQALMYAAMEMGAKEVYGIEDAYMGLNQAERVEAVRKAQVELDRKKCADLDLEGRFSLREEGKELMETFVFCDGCLIAETTGAEETRRQNIYRKGDRFLRVTGEEELQLESCSLKQLIEGLTAQAGFPEAVKNTAGEEKLIFEELSLEELQKAQKVMLDGDKKKAVDMLSAICKTEDAVPILIEALEQKAEQTTMALIDFSDNKVCTMMILKGSSGMVLLEEDAENNRWKLQECSVELLEKKLAKWFVTEE